jgi:hypothetical protein
LIYFGENSDYILCECEVCKREIYAERNTVSEEDAYSYHLANPLKCACGNIDEYINKSKKACYHIRHELAALSDLLHKQQNAASRIHEINAEINKKFNPPTFLQSLAADFMFAGKIFLILLGSVIGLEIFLFIVSALMFFCGIAFDMPDLSLGGNELFYNLNVFKDRGGGLLSRFGFSPEFPALDSELAAKEIIVDYIPYAVAGVIVIVFYVFLAVFIIKAAIDVVQLVFFASRVMNQRIKINQRREEYTRELDELMSESQNFAEQIAEFDVLGADYKNIRATDAILKYFINNRVDTMREAMNLYHEEDFRSKQLEYSKALYNESKQTRRYTKAMYLLTSDSNVKVEVRDELPESNTAKSSGTAKSAFSKIKPPSVPGLNKSTAAAKIKPPVAGKLNRGGAGASDKSEKNSAESKPAAGSGKTETFSSIFSETPDNSKSGGGNNPNPLSASEESAQK